MDSDELHWRMYNDHVTQARQHEDQRERMTTLIVVVAAAAMAFISQNGLEYYDLVLSLPLIILGAFGARFSFKHYERNRMHVKIASGYLRSIDNEIYSIREEQEKQHNETSVSKQTDKLAKIKNSNNFNKP
ncbi:MAG: hypothetical protein HQ521_12925 [Bacteroidetes bacterium]|nr:hypothetical protein [Bacteroidota bacterium]